MSDFNKSCNRISKFVIVMSISFILAWLACVIGIIYVIIHFIAKYW